MAHSMRHVYAERALSQIPRLLTLLDRSPFSPTRGSFKRTYWLDKTVDFPDALPQYGVLALSLAYAHEMPFDPSASLRAGSAQGKPGNIYYAQPTVHEWILSGMRYWTKVQHRDGSFDEFYPNEHGWAGPTGFLLYGMVKSAMLLEERREFPAEFRERFSETCRRAARYLINWEEHGVLANHYAVAALAVFYAAEFLGSEELRRGYEHKLERYLGLCDPEGWSLEYDGADIGYLSASVSFLGKIYKLNRDARIREAMERGIEFLSYFVYPDGSFAGTIGSRNTLHFYPHGCEILAPEFPLAARIADAGLESLAAGKLVPAEIMDDRYFLYRIPEHLECYIDCGERKGSAMLPYEREDFRKVFPRGKFYLEKNGDTYVVANAAKGGVVKIFNTSQRKLLLSDCGVIGKTNEGRVLTSQWIDPASTFTPKENGFSVSGALHAVPAHKVFTPLRMILFRLLLLLFGWHSGLAYAIKGLIRKLLMLRSGRAECFFYRNVELHRDSVRILDILKCTGRTQFSALRLGGEFAVRYVPQSRYFQSCELHTNATPLTPDQLRILNDDGKIQIERHVDLTTGALVTPTVVPVLKGTMGLEYSEGRKSQRALTYRLRRRSEEVIAAIRTHAQGSPRDLLDVGPAEGKVLSRIQDAFPELRCIGLEYSQELIDACTDSRLHMIQGDALTPPFPDASFDIVTATAFIEHVADPQKLLKEIHRVLRPGGIVILTTPQPVFERIAVAIGHLPHEDHQETMTLMKLAEYLRKSDFGVIELRKFMVSPWGLPREQGIEGAMRKLGFSFLFLNQLAVGRKS